MVQEFGLSPKELEVYKKWIAQGTTDPFEAVQQRIEKRLDSPLARQKLSDALRVMRLALARGSTPLLYKANIDMGIVMYFGERATQVDLDRPIVLGEKDRKLLDTFLEIPQVLTDNEMPAIRQKLEEIPDVAPSKCDEGDFDGYNQEVLIVVDHATEWIRQLVPIARYIIEQDRRVKPIRALAPSVGRIGEGLLTSDRVLVLGGLRELIERVSTEIRGKSADK